jgi:hypothetical protein
MVGMNNESGVIARFRADQIGDNLVDVEQADGRRARPRRKEGNAVTASSLHITFRVFDHY